MLFLLHVSVDRKHCNSDSLKLFLLNLHCTVKSPSQWQCANEVVLLVK